MKWWIVWNGMVLILIHAKEMSNSLVRSRRLFRNKILNGQWDNGQWTMDNGSEMINKVQVKVQIQIQIQILVENSY